MDGYCFVCDAPADTEPCPRCGHDLWHETPETPREAEEGPLLVEAREPAAGPILGGWAVAAAMVVILLLLLFVLRVGLRIG